MAYALSKKSNSLLEIAQALDVEPDTVLNLIAKKTQLNKHQVQLVFNSMESGLTIQEMPPSITVEALKMFVPEPPQTELSRDIRAKIRKRFGEGLPVHQIADYLGVSETEVLKTLGDDATSVAESQPSTVVAERPVRTTRAPEESPAVGREIQRRSEADEGIQPAKRRVEEGPQYIYSYIENSSLLLRTTLSTGETREETVRNYIFKLGSVWCEVERDIYFTGGFRDNKYLNEVVRVSGDSLEVTQMNGMLSARQAHGSVYNENYLYAIGGVEEYSIAECERLLVSEDQWKTLTPLPN